MMSVEIQGVPEGLPLSPEDLAADIARRRPGRKGTTARVETDVPEIVRGVEGGVTTGTTLKIVFRNQNIDPSAYRQFVDMPRQEDYRAGDGLGPSDRSGGTPCQWSG